MPIREGTFYGIWPIISGKTIQYQWGEIRSNQAELKALARNSTQELETGVDELNALRALVGQAYGNLDFRNKFRFYYEGTTKEITCQANQGTVEVPIWVDAWQVRHHDGQFQVVSQGGIQSSAGFYGPGLQSLEEVAESSTSADVSVRNPTKIFFNSDDGFGVAAIASGANAGQPEITFTQPFGKAQQFSKAGKLWQVDHNFGISPVMVQVMDADDRVVIPDKADVSNPNTAFFYFNSPFTGSVYIASGGVGAASLVPRDPFYLVTRTDEMPASPNNTLKPNADMIYDSRFFYVNVDLDAAAGGAHKTSFISLTDSATDGNFLTVKETDGSPSVAHVRTINVNNGGLTDNGSGEVTIDLSTAGLDARFNNVTAEGFYVQSGGELSPDGLISASVIAGDAGNEAGGVTVGGVNFTSSLKASDINNDDPVDIHIHKHSATIPAVLMGSRSDALGSGHAAVDDGDALFSIYAAGRNSSTYEISGQILFEVDGTPGSGYVPGNIKFKTNKGADTGLFPDLAMTINSTGHVRLENTLEVENKINAEAFYFSSGGEAPQSYVEEFSASLEWIVNHNLNRQSFIAQAYKGTGLMVIPDVIDVSDPNTSYFYFVELQDGKAVILGVG